MMEEVGVGDAVDCRVNGNRKEEHVCEVFKPEQLVKASNGGTMSLPCRDSRNHSPGSHGFNEENERHY